MKEQQDEEERKAREAEGKDVDEDDEEFDDDEDMPDFDDMDMGDLDDEEAEDEDDLTKDELQRLAPILWLSSAQLFLYLDLLAIIKCHQFVFVQNCLQEIFRFRKCIVVYEFRLRR